MPASLPRDSYKGARLLLVHAHPDDETINNGATMALYASLGADVTLVTCTRGEEGEVLVSELAHLASVHNDVLGEHRIGELSDAMELCSSPRSNRKQAGTVRERECWLKKGNFEMKKLCACCGC